MSLPAGSHLVHLNTQSSLPAFADATTALEAGLFMIGLVGLLVISYRIIFHKPKSSTAIRRWTNVRHKGGSALSFDPNKKQITIHETGTYHITITDPPKENDE